MWDLYEIVAKSNVLLIEFVVKSGFQYPERKFEYYVAVFFCHMLFVEDVVEGKISRVLNVHTCKCSTPFSAVH